MTIQAYQNSGSGLVAVPNAPILAPRAPVNSSPGNPGDAVSPAGNPYQLGQIWRNTITAIVYEYVGAGTWVEISGATGGPIDTLTGNSGGAIGPTNSNVNILGTANQITFTGAGSTLTASLVGPYTPATYAAHSVLLGEGTSSIGTVGPNAASGLPLISQGVAADPIFGTATVPGGGTGAVSFTAHGVILGEGTSALSVTGVGGTGTVLAGISASDPAFHAISELNIVDDTTGTVAAPTTIVVNTTYISDEASVTTGYLLPATAALGDRFTIMGNGPGGWQIQQNASQAIKVGSSSSTTGTGGTVSSVTRYASITLIATVSGASTIWVAEAQSGTFTIV